MANPTATPAKRVCHRELPKTPQNNSSAGMLATIPRAMAAGKRSNFSGRHTRHWRSSRPESTRPFSNNTSTKGHTAAWSDLPDRTQAILHNSNVIDSAARDHLACWWSPTACHRASRRHPRPSAAPTAPAQPDRIPSAGWPAPTTSELRLSYARKVSLTPSPRLGNPPRYYTKADRQRQRRVLRRRAKKNLEVTTPSAASASHKETSQPSASRSA